MPSDLWAFHAGPQFLGDDDTEVFKWREGPMEALERLVGNWMTEYARGLD